MCLIFDSPAPVKPKNCGRMLVILQSPSRGGDGIVPQCRQRMGEELQMARPCSLCQRAFDVFDMLVAHMLAVKCSVRARRTLEWCELICYGK